MRPRCTVLITGATDGIGAELVRLYSAQYQAQDIQLLLLGRAPLANTFLTTIPSCNYLPIDLAAPEAPTTIAQWVSSLKVPHIDKIYLNAATGYVGDFSSHSISDITQLLTVNTLSPLLTIVELQRYCNHTTTITIVGSTASRWYHSSYAVYAASKAALTAAVRAYQYELRGTRAPKVILAHPGPTRTGMHAKSGMDAAAINRMHAMPADQVAMKLANTQSKEHSKEHGKEKVIGAINLLGWKCAKLRQLPIGIFHRGPKLPQNSSKQVLIVGGADGVGAQLAYHYYQKGWGITIADKSSKVSSVVQRLHNLPTHNPAPTVQGKVVDVSDPSAINTIININTKWQLVFYTAAISAVGPLCAIDPKVYHSVHAVNFQAPAVLISALLSGSKLEPHARVVLFSSLSHYTNYPGAAYYSATKSGLAILAAALNTRKQDVRYSVVFPGPVHTAHAQRYSPTASDARRMSPQKVSRIVARKVEAGHTIIIPGIANTIFALIGFVIPSCTSWVLGKSIYNKITRLLLPPQ